MTSGPLIGLWSDLELYQGSMEACDIVFLADGGGWYQWENFGGAFEMLRFRWRALLADRVELRLYEYLWGMWDLRGSRVHHHAKRRQRETRTQVMGYEIRPGVDALRRPVTVLELAEKVGQASRYALVRRDVRATEDPVRATDTGKGSSTVWRAIRDRGEPASSSTG